MNKKWVTAACVFLIASAAFAGDVAQFVNLGFSEDADTFMFGQYGILDESSRPYAEIYLVDVPANDFVRNGVHRRVFETPVSLGHDGSAALHRLVREQAALLDDYGVDHLDQGRMIYVLIDGATPDPSLSFRDFQRDIRYDVVLVQDSRGSGTDVSAAFHIDLRVDQGDGRVQTLRIGLPEFYREGVQSYLIRQILLTPDESGIVFVVEMRRPTENGRGVRYMVETASLD
jgi:predicted secreted protein